MEFALTDEQILLRDSVRRFVSEEHEFSVALAAARSEDGFSRAHWQIFAELGWLALLISEEGGGLGGRLEDAAIIAEALGRGLVSAPFLSTAVLCAGIVDAAHDFAARSSVLEKIVAGELLVALASEEQQSRYELASVTARAKAHSDGFVLSGRKIMVIDGASADAFIVSVQMDEGIGLFFVTADAPDLDIRRYRTIDGRKAADLGLDGVRLAADALIASPEHGLDLLERMRDRASLVMAAEALGVMEGALDLTAEHLRTRHQFGRALGTFQSLSHRLADMFVAHENARSMVFRGLAFSDASATARAGAVSATMLAVEQAGEFVGGNAIQLHGGIGMANENAVGHHYKRLRAISKTHGDRSWHLARYMRLNDKIEGAA
ncbi:alkylation response protein AidB-like acyl-CoA dehydrogenase [Rhodoligotrophos appendicifer]|uniref:acyl-CoA dehydrogenase family protein n=1 Tax=Rhodoligotrophos appendicifer TaxID=987056 RepID=UPI001185F2CE|nr:acyl-CoA dehydrogenase [Rhodoligotrophos appendicifer]